MNKIQIDTTLKALAVVITAFEHAKITGLPFELRLCSDEKPTLLVGPAYFWHEDNEVILGRVATLLQKHNQLTIEAEERKIRLDHLAKESRKISDERSEIASEIRDSLAPSLPEPEKTLSLGSGVFQETTTDEDDR